MKILDMNIKPVFLDAIINGSKNVEYRDMSDYWAAMLLDLGGRQPQEVIDDIKYRGAAPKPKEWTHIRFKDGKREVLVEMQGIKTYPSRSTFCIGLGKITKIQY